MKQSHEAGKREARGKGRLLKEESLMTPYLKERAKSGKNGMRRKGVGGGGGGRGGGLG